MLLYLRGVYVMRMLSKAQVKELVLYSPQHIPRQKTVGKFPIRVKLGDSRVGWIEDEGLDWSQICIGSRDTQWAMLDIGTFVNRSQNGNCPDYCRSGNKISFSLDESCLATLMPFKEFVTEKPYSKAGHIAFIFWTKRQYYRIGSTRPFILL